MGTDRDEGTTHGGDAGCDAALSASDDLRPWAQRGAITPEMIHALPEPLRRYVHDLETRCDPAGDLQTIGSLTEQRAGLLEQVRELQGELAAWRTLALGYRGVPGLPDDVETDTEAIARIRTELGEARALASLQEALTLPRHVAVALVNVERALRARDRTELATVHPVLQPIVDAALVWVGDATRHGPMPSAFSLQLAIVAIRARDRRSMGALHPALQPLLREVLAWVDQREHPAPARSEQSAGDPE